MMNPYVEAKQTSNKWRAGLVTTLLPLLELNELIINEKGAMPAQTSTNSGHTQRVRPSHSHGPVKLGFLNGQILDHQARRIK